MSPQEFDEVAARNSAAQAQLQQALARRIVHPPRLWLITRGAQRVVASDRSVSLGAAAVSLLDRDYEPPDGVRILGRRLGQPSYEDVAKFLGVSPKNKIKTLALMADEFDAAGKKKSSRPIVVLMRGDHQLNEAKLNGTVATATRPMEESEIEALFNSPAGYLGPVGIDWARDMKNPNGKPVLLVDKALEGRVNLIAGANKKDYHLKNLTPGNDFHPTAYADLRAVTAGEGCPTCGKPLRIDSAVEIGHIFKLGYRYSEAMGLRVLDKYAVRCGGGQNHRLDLSDGVLIKNNHIALAGGIAPTVN